MLKSLRLHGVGPVHDLTASFGERLNVVAGDNGLGKSFLLDVCFWALTGAWPGGRTAVPDGEVKSPTIQYEVRGKSKSADREASYDYKSQTWRRRGRPATPGLVIYAAVDGSFAVWDPARNHHRESNGAKDVHELPRAFQFRPHWAGEQDEAAGPVRRRDVANGLEEGGRVVCNGLISDWVEWYYQRSSAAEPNPFQYLEAVVEALSHPLEPLKCEEPRKAFLNDSRKFPTLRMPYGVVSYPQWSAGVKRVVGFAYLVVWAWTEHLLASALRKEPPTDQIVLLVDEIEAHLHPKWQRTILPALLEVVNKLNSDISVQILAATHSPLVLASIEPRFDEERDELFCFNFHADRPNGRRVTFDDMPWARHGDVVAWLTSDVFGLAQARSREAEAAIEAAEAFLRGDAAALPPGLRTRDAISQELRSLLSGLDPFWPRWIVETGSEAR